MCHNIQWLPLGVGGDLITARCVWSFRLPHHPPSLHLPLGLAPHPLYRKWARPGFQSVAGLAVVCYLSFGAGDGRGPSLQDCREYLDTTPCCSQVMPLCGPLGTQGTPLPLASHPRGQGAGEVLISDLVPFVVSVWALMINCVLGSPGDGVAWLSWFFL